jgi:signal transduction histidine kinase
VSSDGANTTGQAAPLRMLSRLGVASRLLLAFLGICTLAMVGAAVAIFSFREIGEVLERVTARRVPAALASQEVSRQAERIIAVAPALLSAATPAEHAQRSRNIAAEMGTLDDRLDKLESGGGDSVSLGSMRLAVNRLWTNLKSLDRLVGERLILTERKRDQLRNALAIRADAQALLTPWLQIVEGEIAQSRRAIANAAQKGEERAIAANRLLDSTEAYHALQRAQFLIASASDRLQQIVTADDADGLRVQVFRIQQALSEARQTAGNLDSRLRPLLLSMLDEFEKHTAGNDSIPELRQRELSIIALATRHLNDNSVLSTDLTEAVDGLVSRAKRDISEANDDALSVQKFSETVLIVAVALSLISSILIVWLYVGRNIVSRLTALNRSMLAITEGNLQANVPTRGNDEIAEMGRVVEVLRQNTLERDELLIERAHTAERLEKQVEERTAELARSVEELRALGEVSQAVNSTLDLETVLETIIAKAVQLSGTDAGTIYVFDELSEEFQVHASFGMAEELVEALKQRHIKLGETMVSAVTMERRSIQVADTQKEDSSLVLDMILRAGFRALLTVPLLGANRTIGALVVRRKTPGEFPKRIVDLLQTFAAQSVLAIDNARLFDEVQSRTRELAGSLKNLQVAQDRLIQTEKLASLGQLTAGIAHEIKNPLNFVNNFSAISTELVEELKQALAGAPLEDKLRISTGEIAQMLQDNLDKVVQHGKRADAIVKNMLLHSREGSGQHRPVDINSLVEESLNLAYHGARAEKQGFNITLERSFDPAAGQADVFPQDITRVLLNLISNGFYAATKRKAETGDGYEPTIVTSTRSLGDRVEIRVRDNGTGIPSEVKEKIFNPFFTTKPAGEGTGLGLSISHDVIVKQHGGSIEVETKPGAFSEFIIVLPRAGAPLATLGESS